MIISYASSIGMISKGCLKTQRDTLNNKGWVKASPEATGRPATSVTCIGQSRCTLGIINRFTKRSDKQKVVAPESMSALTLIISLVYGFLISTWKIGRWPTRGGVTVEITQCFFEVPALGSSDSHFLLTPLTPLEVPALGSSENKPETE